MFPIKVEIAAGTLDIKSYDFKNNKFIGSNDKNYSIDEINYFIIPKEEMKKILKINEAKVEEIKPVQFTKKSK